MELHIHDDTCTPALLSRCSWSKDSTSPQSLFGTDFRYVPWAYTLNPDGSYTDTISKTQVTDRPPVPVFEDNFAFKGIGAQLCRQQIDASMQPWLTGLLPTEMQANVELVLKRVRVAVEALVLCGVGSDNEGCAELDTALAASRIISKYPEHGDDQLRQDFECLEFVSRASWRLLCMIRGFCALLQGFQSLEAASSSTTEFKKLWTSEHIDAHSLSIARFCSEILLPEQINDLRRSLQTRSLSEAAFEVAVKYTVAVDDARQRLDAWAAETPWPAEIVAVKWNQPLPHVSRLSSFFRYRGIERHRIALFASNHLVPHRPEPMIQSVVSVKCEGSFFYFSTEDVLQMYPGTTLQVQLQWIDDGAFRRGPTTQRLSTSFVFDNDDDSRRRVPGTRRLETELSNHVIEVDMLESDIGRKFARLDKCHWTRLLNPGPLMDADDPSKLLLVIPKLETR